ncbi:MAG: hypothetical protein HC869_27515 [Rhodospirillales bacterium]|nr:hypothetical protein [Rhodospirillales bacterium]
MNQATGTIQADNGSAVYTFGPSYAGGIDNSGTIIASGNLIPDAPFISGGLGIRMLANTVSGTFQNRATGLIDGRYIGASFEGSTFNGLFRNEGRILGGDPLETTGFGYGFGATFSYNVWNGDIINEATGSIAAR